MGNSLNMRLIITMVAVFFLSGCMKVGPDFHRPNAVIAPDWIEAGDARVKTGPADYRNWWQVFNDPVLDKLVDRAYRENLNIRIAGVRVLEARAQLGIAAQGIYPQNLPVSGSIEYNRPSAAGAVPSSVSEYYQSQAGLNASWELDFWGKFRRIIESADAAWLASVADYDTALVSLTADVAGSYITIRTLEKRIEIARQNAEIQNDNLKIAEARFKYGTVTQLDVEQARTVLNDTLAAVPSLEAQLRQAMHALSVLLGAAPGDLRDYLQGASDIPVSPPQVAIGIPADLLTRRPDIRSAAYQAAAQSAQIGAAKADLYPAFSLAGNFNFVASDVGKSKLSDMFKWNSRSILAGPSFGWDILNYGRIINNVRVQDARLQELLITYQNTVLRAQQEVEDSLVAFLRAQERAELLALSTAAAKKALDLAALQYRRGVKDFTTVLTAQQALLNEQDNLAVTLGSISGNLVVVYRALGGGWEVREGKEFLNPEDMEAMSKRTNWGNMLAPASYIPPAGVAKSSPGLISSQGSAGPENTEAK
jgi:NodT family efflux transporter outer membrane factor (OMF) lipoprotein